MTEMKLTRIQKTKLDIQTDSLGNIEYNLKVLINDLGEDLNENAELIKTLNTIKDELIGNAKKGLRQIVEISEGKVL